MDYCEVKLDLSKGSAYEFNKDSEIPCEIKYRRIYSGRIDENTIKGKFTYNHIHDIVFCIKRGCSLDEINELISASSLY